MNKIKKIHMMGIGGSGISGVAKLAFKMGYEVSGCDLEASTAYGKAMYKGHSPEHLRGVDMLVISPAVRYQNKDNTELAAGEAKGMVVTWQEFLGRFLAKDKKVICVAGTHGKSTTTAMAGKLLIDASLDPTVVVGAKIPEWQGNARFGKGSTFVIEADEFNNNFLNYSPEIIILNNIEFDHPDYFKNEEDVFNSFKTFVERLIGRRMLIVNEDSLGVNKLLQMIDRGSFEIYGYSLEKNKFKLNLTVMGDHNISNALGVVKLGELLGIDPGLIRKSLEGFKGIGRRLELIAQNHGITVYDDYAHHPTAIQATLSALRGKYKDAKIWAIDEPHGYLRTKALLDLYRGCFRNADNVMIGPIFQARDKETFGITPEIVAESTNHKDAEGFDTFEELKKVVLKQAKKGDVILVMGAGKSYLWAREIAKSL